MAGLNLKDKGRGYLNRLGSLTPSSRPPKNASVRRVKQFSRGAQGVGTLFGARELSAKRKIVKPKVSRQQKRLADVQRIIQLQKQNPEYNTNQKAVVRKHEVDRQRMKVEQALRSQQLSPQTRLILERLMRIQNKGARDEAEMQRRIRERRIVGDASNLLKTPFIFGKDSAKFDVLEMEGNILQAPNVFKEIEENKILRPRGTTILNTKEAGNDLKF